MSLSRNSRCFLFTHLGQLFCQLALEFEVAEIIVGLTLFFSAQNLKEGEYHLRHSLEADSNAE